jgi:hypothetical protein
MNTGEPNQAGKAILEVIDNQINDNNPPQVKETFDRLRKMGISRKESKKYIACAFSVELFDVMKHGKEMDYDRYFTNLENLPEMPWQDE